MLRVYTTGQFSAINPTYKNELGARGNKKNPGLIKIQIMKILVSLLTFTISLTLLIGCKKIDDSIQYSTIQLTNGLKVKFHANKSDAWTTLDGITIRLEDTASTRFYLTIPNLDKGTYYFSAKELIQGESRANGLGKLLGTGFGIINDTNYCYVNQGYMNILDTSKGCITATYKIYGVSTNIKSSPFKIEDGLINNVPITKLDYNTIKDNEGNEYMTIKIGSQNWMAENLRATKYSDGSTINGVSAQDRDEMLIKAYGRFYTWDACMNNNTSPTMQGACPVGWHVPSDNEWKLLLDGLGGEEFAGIKLESIKGWWRDYLSNYYTSITNITGFTARLAGYYRWDEQDYSFQESETRFWTSTSKPNNDSIKWCRYINIFSHYNVLSLESHKKGLYSVRCIKDN